MSISERSTTVIPKIAVPIVSSAREEILADAECIASSCADIAEWRADFFETLYDAEKIAELTAEIRKALAGKALLLFTCRTSAEGGEAEISAEDYRKLLFCVIKSGAVDMIDAEFAAAGEFLEELIDSARNNGVAVVLSYHNFKETPDRETILIKYEDMFNAGGHILKIAVMPNSTEDVDRMISASRAAKEKFNRMIIPIVMGEMGQCTRIAAETVGSFLTFGMIGEKSAPGQIDVQMLYKMMEKVHKNIGEFCGAKDSKELNNLIEKYCK